MNVFQVKMADIKWHACSTDVIKLAKSRALRAY